MKRSPPPSVQATSGVKPRWSNFSEWHTEPPTAARPASPTSQRRAALYEQIGDIKAHARSLANFSQACAQAGRMQEGLTAIRRAIALHSETGPPPVAHLHSLGALLLGSGDAAGAERAFRQCLGIVRNEGQTLFETITLVTLGDSLRRREGVRWRRRRGPHPG